MTDRPEPELTWINGRWPVLLPPHRACRPEWPWWEATRLAAMHHFIKPGHVVYDVGAEEGDFPTLFATWGAQVVLIEPNPYVWPCIRYTWEANFDHRPLGHYVGLLGVADVDAPETDIERGTVDGWPRCTERPMVPDHGFRHLWEHGGRNTPITTLDHLVARLGHIPDVVTMDVEGGELFVLRGAEHTLTEHRPIVFVSIHPDFMAEMYDIGDGITAVNDLMAGHGYEHTYLCTDHEVHMLYLPPQGAS